MKDSEELQKVIEMFWDTIPPVWNRVRRNARNIAVNEYHITLVQFHILRHVRRGASSASELAGKQQTSRPAISQAVDSLVVNGYLTRHQDAEDRRFVHLELTPKSDNLLQEIFHKNREWMAEQMKNLKQEDLQTIIDAMTILHIAFAPAEK
jgi:DNA-binding MarR family transcriptional regulator